MTREQVDTDIQTIKKIIEDKGFIFTEKFMTAPVVLGAPYLNDLLDSDYGYSGDKIAIEAGTFWLNYDYDNKELIPNITSWIFQDGPTDKVKRFSLYTLNYQVNPINYTERLIGFRGSFW